MITIDEFIASLGQQNVKVWAEGENLRYRGPREALTPEILGQLRTRKQELLEFCRNASAATEGVPALVLAPRDGPLPLTSVQQGLWFVCQSDRQNASYNIPVALRISGALDNRVLEKSINEIYRRHEVLRAVFQNHDGEPKLTFAPLVHVAIPVTDLQHLPPEDRLAEARRLAGEEKRRPFDLASGKLFRVSLLALSENDHVLLLTMHHIISDLWSVGLLVNELTELHRTALTGERPILPELPIQYADFAAWQRQWIGSAAMQGQIEYWKAQLSGAPPLLELPTDRPRPAVQTFNGDGVRFKVSARITEQLQRLSQSSHATLFMTLESAFAVLLSRYCNQKDVVIGTPTANRNDRKIEGLIGCFVNSLALRNDLSGNPTFVELLQRSRKIALDAFARQETPFEEVVRALQPERNSSYSPVFQVVFAMENARVKELQLSGLAIAPLATEYGSCKYDLTLEIEESGGILAGNLEYNTDLFDRPAIERMAEHFTRLLEGIAADPLQLVGNISLLSSNERECLLNWAGPRLKFPVGETLHQLFERRAAQNPDSTAMTLNGVQMNYRDLNRRANQLAHHLKFLGVGPETLVGICVERSFEMIIGMLGALKAGGAYLPIDPSCPPDRLAFIVEDACAPVLLIQEKLAATLSATKCKTLRLDADWEIVAAQPSHNPASTSNPDNLAYVIYTSGSTGRPKGVQVTHANVARLFSATDAWFHFGADDVWTLFHSFAFDFSVWEIWGALLYGGRLVIVPYSVSRSPDEFHALLQRENITVLNQTPSAFKQLIDVDSGANQALNSLRYVIFGGEALEPRTLKNWYKRHSERSPQLVNMYGITETTVHVTYYPLTLADTECAASTIGEPIPDLQVYVLDEQCQPAPLNVPGEIYVGGAGVARGYLNRPELTAERFIKSPFDTVPGAFLYKSGDLARFRPDGRLEYLGRGDQQIKIRGFRIELGEIEAVLARVNGVRNCAVIARADSNGNKQIVAYTVTEVDANILRQQMRARLPDYMVPAHFVKMRELPLTTNGKLDSRALPAPEVESAENRQFAAPENEYQQRMVELWERVLGRKHIGIHDNFFDLGGHSLTATQLAARIRKELGANVGIQKLFAAPTVAALCAVSSIGNSRAGETPIERIPDAPHHATSHAQKRIWLYEQMHPGTAAYNIAGAYLFEGALNVNAFGYAINALFERHEILRTVFISLAGEPRQVVKPAPVLTRDKFEFEWGKHSPQTAVASAPMFVDLSTLEDPETKVVVMARVDATQPFDLENGPLIRVKLVRLRKKRFVVLLSLHHIVFDGWSMGTFLNEFAAFYGAFSSDKPDPFSALRIQFRDAAAWQNRILTSDAVHPLRTYWRHLNEFKFQPALKPDNSGALRTFAGRTHEFTLGRVRSENLRALCIRQDCSLLMGLLAALNASLYRMSGRTEFCVGAISGGRCHIDLEPQIGLYLNTLPIACAVQPESTFETLLRLVRERTLGAFEHQQYPVDQIAEDLALPADTSLFNISVNLLNLDRENATQALQSLPGGVSVRRFDVPVPETVKFELSLVFWEFGSEILGGCQYSTERYRPETIETFVSALIGTLDLVLACPAAPLKELRQLREKSVLERAATAPISDDF